MTSPIQTNSVNYVWTHLSTMSWNRNSQRPPIVGSPINQRPFATPYPEVVRLLGDAVGVSVCVQENQEGGNSDEGDPYDLKTD